MWSWWIQHWLISKESGEDVLNRSNNCRCTCERENYDDMHLINEENKLLHFCLSSSSLCYFPVKHCTTTFLICLILFWFNFFPPAVLRCFIFSVPLGFPVLISIPLSFSILSSHLLSFFIHFFSSVLEFLHSCLFLHPFISFILPSLHSHALPLCPLPFDFLTPSLLPFSLHSQLKRKVQWEGQRWMGRMGVRGREPFYNRKRKRERVSIWCLI